MRISFNQLTNEVGKNQARPRAQPILNRSAFALEALEATIVGSSADQSIYLSIYLSIYRDMNAMKLVIPYIHCSGQFTPKMKGSAEPQFAFIFGVN